MDRVVFKEWWGRGNPHLTDVDGDRTSLRTVMTSIIGKVNSFGLARAIYDFNEMGGAIGNIGLGESLPDNAIVTRSWYEVIETLTSSTDAATVAIGIPTDDVAGIVAATAISAGGNVWDEGKHEGIQVGTVATMSEKTTAERELTMTIGVQALTAGKVVLFCEYVIST